jgi:hypothetical protein
MEVANLNKTLVYLAFAVILGLSLTLLPLFAVTEFTAKNGYGKFYEAIPNGVESLDSPTVLGESRYSTTDFEILAISFIAALIVYALSKYRTGR